MVSASSSITTGPGLLATALRRAFSDPPAPVRPAPLPQAAGTRSADGQPSSVVSLSQESRLMADLSSLADRIASARAERQPADDTQATVQDGVTQQLSASIEASRQAADEALASLGQRLSAPEDQPNVVPAANADLATHQAAAPAADQTSDLARIEANAQNARQAASADATASGEAPRPTPPDAQALPLSLQNQLQQASAAYAQVAQLQPGAAQPTRTSEAAAAPASHAEQHNPTA